MSTTEPPAALGRLLAAWFTIWEGRWMASSDVIRYIYYSDPNFPAVRDIMRDAIEALCGGRPSAKSLGRRLMLACGVVVDGLYLEQTRDRTRLSQWWVRRAESAAAAVVN
jgi:hypothetical protein